jgi:hypothetical protein
MSDRITSEKFTPISGKRSTTDPREERISTLELRSKLEKILNVSEEPEEEEPEEEEPEEEEPEDEEPQDEEPQDEEPQDEEPEDEEPQDEEPQDEEPEEDVIPDEPTTKQRKERMALREFPDSPTEKEDTDVGIVLIGALGLLTGVLLYTRG